MSGFMLNIKFKSESSGESLKIIKKVNNYFEEENYKALEELFINSDFDYSSSRFISFTKSMFPAKPPYEISFENTFAHELLNSAGECQVFDFALKGKGRGKGLKNYEININGDCHESQKFCIFFMAFLYATKVSNLTAEGWGDFIWDAEWEESDSTLVVTYEEMREEGM